MPLTDSHARRMKLTVAAANVVAGPHSGLPVLITGAVLPAALFSQAQANGGDLRASADQAGTIGLPLEVVRFDPASNSAVLWIKLASLSSSAANEFYLWWLPTGAAMSQPAATDPVGRNAVWSQYSRAWHMVEDSAGSGQALSVTGSATWAATGKIGKALHTSNGGGGYVGGAIPNLENGGKVTLCGWFKYAGSSRADQTLAAIHDGSAYRLRTGRYYVGADANATANNPQATWTGGWSTLSDGQWHWVALLYDDVSMTISLWVDAVQRGTGTGTWALWGPTSQFTLGAAHDHSAASVTEGLFEAWRWLPTIKSSGWLQTAYANENAPASFVSAGPVETLGGASLAPVAARLPLRDAAATLSQSQSVAVAVTRSPVRDFGAAISQTHMLYGAASQTPLRDTGVSLSVLGVLSVSASRMALASATVSLAQSHGLSVATARAPVRAGGVSLTGSAPPALWRIATPIGEPRAFSITENRTLPISDGT
jgi:hypothetical protein